MRKILLPGLVLLAALPGCRQAPPYEPFADNLLLMQAIVDPQADVIWGSVGTIATLEGTEDFYPRNDEEWAVVRNATVAVIESANLLMMRPPEGDDGSWVRLSKDMIAAGKVAFDAAESKDPDAIFAVGGELYAACNACHEKYWVGDKQRYPGDNVPAGPGL